MNETPQNAWFYTQEGERCGPATFSELRVKAAEGTLNPRLDMVWTQGMDNWKASGEIEGLFEKREPEVKPSLAPAADPYKPPQQESVADRMSREEGWPGARRRTYLLAIFVIPFLVNILAGVSAPLLTAQFGQEIAGIIVIAASVVPMIVAIYFGIQRLANVGMSRWWYLGNLVPFLNIWVGYRSFACPAGYAYHKKLDGAGVALAIIYWLMFAIVLLAIALVIALMLGAVGDPAIQQKLREIIETAQAAQKR